MCTVRQVFEARYFIFAIAVFGEGDFEIQVGSSAVTKCTLTTEKHEVFVFAPKIWLKRFHQLKELVDVVLESTDAHAACCSCWLSQNTRQANKTEVLLYITFSVRS